MTDSPKDRIFKLLREKVVAKQVVFEKTQEAFYNLKSVLRELYEEIQKGVNATGKLIPVEFLDRGNFQVEFTVADDTLIFLLQTNIYTFEPSHEIWKSSYVQDDANRAFCGKIYVYNFLTDSFKYNHGDDLGILIARIFVNKDSHYFVQGKESLNFLFNNFQESQLDPVQIRNIAEAILLYSMDHDPWTPTYDEVSQISVKQIQSETIQTRLVTGERLGFRFQADSKAK